MRIRCLNSGRFRWAAALLFLADTNTTLAATKPISTRLGQKNIFCFFDMELLLVCFHVYVSLRGRATANLAAPELSLDPLPKARVLCRSVFPGDEAERRRG